MSTRFALYLILVLNVAFGREQTFLGMIDESITSPKNWSLGITPSENDTLLLQSKEAVFNELIIANTIIINNSRINFLVNPRITSKFECDNSDLNGSYLVLDKLSNFRIFRCNINIELKIQSDELYLFDSEFHQRIDLTIHNDYNSIRGRNTYHKPVHFQFYGNDELRIDNFSGSVYTDSLTINNLSNGNVSIAIKDTSYFYAPIHFQNTQSHSIFMGSKDGLVIFKESAKLELETSAETRLHLNQVIDSTSNGINFNQTYTSLYLTKCQLNNLTTLIAKDIYLEGNTFNQACIFNKTGNSQNVSHGGNTFNQATLFQQQGDGEWVLAGNKGNTFNDDAVFIRSGSGILRPTHSDTSTFHGNINVQSWRSVYFGQNNGVISFEGNVQTIESNQSLHFEELDIKSKDSLRLESDIIIHERLNLNNTKMTGIHHSIEIRNPSPSAISFDQGRIHNGIELIRKVNQNHYSLPITTLNDTSLIQYEQKDAIDNEIRIAVYHIDENNYPGLYDVQTPFGRYSTPDSLIGNTLIDWRSSEQVEAQLTLHYPNNKTWNGHQIFAWDYDENIWSGGLVNGTYQPEKQILTIDNPPNKASFIMAGVDDILPIELVLFKVKTKENQNLILWETASYYNSSHFEVIRHTKDQSESLGKIHTLKSNSFHESFSISDHHPKESCYYELKHYDLNGEISHSSKVFWMKENKMNYRYHDQKIINHSKSDLYLISNSNQIISVISENNTFSTSGLSKGIYFLRQGDQMEKIIIN